MRSIWRDLKGVGIGFALAAAVVGIVVACSTNSATAQSPSIAVKWAAPTAYTNATAIPGGTAITYNVYRGGSGAESAVALSSGITSTSYTDPAPVPGIPQCYVVTAVVNAVESARSTEGCATVALLPSAPTGVTATASG